MKQSYGFIEVLSSPLVIAVLSGEMLGPLQRIRRIVGGPVLALGCWVFNLAAVPITKFVVMSR